MTNLAIPGYMNFNGTQFNGAVILGLSNTSVSFLATINHMLHDADDFKSRNVQHVFFINNYIYTKSECLIRINQVSPYDSKGVNITIPCNPEVSAKLASGGSLSPTDVSDVTRSN
jgi:hypothetical protein